MVSLDSLKKMFATGVPSWPVVCVNVDNIASVWSAGIALCDALLAVSAGSLPRQSRHSSALRVFRVGFVGRTGTGKSSLVNAVRGVKVGHFLAALTDEVECTAMVAPHCVIVRPSEADVSRGSGVILALYDVPGCGTALFPSKTYWSVANVARFDLVVLVLASRVMEDDVQLVTQCTVSSKALMIVRTKVDVVSRWKLPVAVPRCRR
jgi:predicted GTPase